MSVKKSEKEEDVNVKLEMTEAGRLFIAIDQLAVDFAMLDSKDALPPDIKSDVIEVIKVYKSILVKMKK